ncbi:DEAD/DEAH box helicase [Persicobacter psychrovividus]|uniref:AAA+ ATPase domain-containing protein n=1 Tax=Persicobacter psychrovividus TaxID=387638 RepID=A0ABM7VKW6_9BACT|nr:hypothetical protein PEPS_39080 [Persicobacter psychrovividus]
MIDQFLAYLKKEQALNIQKVRELSSLSVEGVEERGLMIDNATFVITKFLKSDGYGCLHLPYNETKLKRGENFMLKAKDNSRWEVKAEVLGMGEDKLWFQLGYNPGGQYALNDLDDGTSMRLTLIPFDAVDKVREAFINMEGNTAAEHWLKQLMTPNGIQLPELEITALQRKQVADLEDQLGRSLNSSQRQVLLKCLSLPKIMGIQGPPGTGKTDVLGQLIYLLLQAGKSVNIIGFTHQSVNNALSEVFDKFPALNVVKLGSADKNEGLSAGVKIQSARYAHRGAQSLFGLTYYGALYHHQKVKADVLIVDEAGQLPLTLAATMASWGAESLLFFGDQRQMEPIFDEGMADDPFSCSILTHLEKYHPNTLLAFDTTYRMNSTLARWVGELFYPSGKTNKEVPTFLKASAFNHDREFQLSTTFAEPWASIFSKAPLVWVDSCDQFARQINQDEAAFLVQLIIKALEGGMSIKDIAVVIPFRKQILEVQNQLSKYLKVKHQPLIDTVEKIQGQSVEMVIVGYTAADPEYVADIGQFIFSANRLNVAISRAKTKVIFLCSPNLLKGVPATWDDLMMQKNLRKLREGADVRTCTDQFK